MVLVISLGGSLLSPKPGEIDIEFLRKFKDTIRNINEKVIIVCGGGKIARQYQAAAMKFGVKGRNLDYIGIAATRLNAELVKSAFKAKIIGLRREKIDKIAISCGFEPGHSTDYDAVLLAKLYGAREVINLTNIDCVYDRDPKDPNAKPIKRINVKEYLKIVGSRWIPGKSFPFDPIAAKLASKYKIAIAIMNGRNLENLKKYIKGKKEESIGTIIEP
jgi:uridylate kinase